MSARHSIGVFPYNLNMAQSKPYLFERLTNPQDLERAWLDVLAHYPKDRIPQDLRAFDRKRGGELQRLATSLRDRSSSPNRPP